MRRVRALSDWIVPDWPAPARVRAISTTRRGGVSRGPWAGFNLADHVGDDPQAVTANRLTLREALALPVDPTWLRQVHGCTVADASGRPGCSADAAFADRPGIVCAVLTADCLPVLLCNRAGTRVAAVHAGWRGLAAGVVERALDRFGDDPADILAWLGPAIGPQAFEVGPDVLAAFTESDPGAEVCFRPLAGRQRWLADLYGLARRRLKARGISAVSGGELCTYSDPVRFYSYRRDGETGRMATLIWLDAN